MENFFSKSISISGLIPVVSKLCELPEVGVLIALVGGLYLDLDRRECL